MIKPLGNRIFLKKDEQPDRKGDIILLKKEGMYAPPYSGTIIGVGDGVEDKEYFFQILSWLDSRAIKKSSDDMKRQYEKAKRQSKSGQQNKINYTG